MVRGVPYPIHLGLAYLFLSGYAFSRLFRALRLPGAVGIIVSGFIFSHFMQQDILDGREHLQSLAFFLVLLTAGFEINVEELNVVTFVYALIPVTLELLGVAVFAVAALQYSWVEGLVLGATLCCLGDGLVIPKMMEFKSYPDFEDLRMPRLVFTWAPLEASYILTFFGVIAGLAEPRDQETTSVPALVFANILRLVATLVFGLILGWLAAQIIVRRDDWMVPSWMRFSEPEKSEEKESLEPFFMGGSVEAYLIILAFALAGFGFGATEGATLFPMPFSPGSLFQPELLVIVIGASFAYFAEALDAEQEALQHAQNEAEESSEERAAKDSSESTLEGVMDVVAGVWTFGQLVLFSMLGSKTDLGVFQQVLFVLPLALVGISCRFVGVLAVTKASVRFRVCAAGCQKCRPGGPRSRWAENEGTWWADAWFCFLSTLPRATIQGALGPIPMRDRFFSSDHFGQNRSQFIAAAARLYVVCMAVVGSILLDRYGTRSLQDIKSFQQSHKDLVCLKGQQEEVAKTRSESIAPCCFRMSLPRKSTAYRQSVFVAQRRSSTDAYTAAPVFSEHQEISHESMPAEAPAPHSPHGLQVPSERPRPPALSDPESSELLRTRKTKGRDRTVTFGAEVQAELQQWGAEAEAETKAKAHTLPRSSETGFPRERATSSARPSVFGSLPGFGSGNSNAFRDRAHSFARRARLHSMEAPRARHLEEEDELWSGGDGQHQVQDLRPELREKLGLAGAGSARHRGTLFGPDVEYVPLAKQEAPESP
ncbi:unnamed protein product [Effrenium voratum]|uniref:Uncharacterized protein n=1 Tax=Effrenium voratum TaxID=2562239 RepID=A0AA36HKC9_9DINO|nr:unnamed protein product [Effrenium voratum]